MPSKKFGIVYKKKLYIHLQAPQVREHICFKAIPLAVPVAQAETCLGQS